MLSKPVDNWLEIARERAADADSISVRRISSIGSVYFAGYAIECSLKAFLQHKGIPVPTRGREGHNLKNLWESCGFKYSDLKDNDGTKTFFISDWSTDLRYKTSLDTSHTIPELVDGAKKLSGFVQNKIRRVRRRR